MSPLRCGSRARWPGGTRTGSVFPQIAAVGVPLVGVVDPALNVPDYLFDISTAASTVEQVLVAVESAEPLDRQTLRRYVGPLNRAGRTLVLVWFSGSRRPVRR